jgi:dCTP deaminase
MMLGERDLLREWKQGGIRFDPNISAEQIGLSSIDLRLGYIFARQKAQPAVVIRPAHDFDPSDQVENFTRASGEIVQLKPGEFILAQTLEKVSVPSRLAAHVNGKSSLARAGLAVHITAPHIHPGFVGPITLELFNHGRWELEFFPGQDAVCQIVFWEVKTPPKAKAIEVLGTYHDQKVPYPPRRKTNR